MFTATPSRSLLQRPTVCRAVPPPAIRFGNVRPSLQTCPRCGLTVPGLLMLDHAINHCPRSPCTRRSQPLTICLSSGRPSAQHDECAD